MSHLLWVSSDCDAIDDSSTVSQTRSQPRLKFHTPPEEPMATNLVQIENDSEIKQRLEAERARLRKIAGLDQPDTFPPSGGACLYGRRTRPRNDPVRWLYLEARRFDSRGIPGLRLSLRKAAGAGRACLPDRQGIRQQRPVQSRPISRSATWCSICSFWRRKAFRASRFWTTTSSSPPVRAVRAASACMRPSIDLR